MPDNNANSKLPNRALITYGGLAIPIAIAELPIIIYLPAFYSKEVGLSIGMVGLVFLLARLWDGITDPIVGTLSDRTNSRFGRRKPWVVLGVPLWMTATWFLCNPPEQVGLFYLFLWAAVFYASHTIVKIPYWSWGAELSSNYEERSKITGFRESGSMLGNLLVAAAPVFLLSKDAPVRDVLLLISMLIIILIPLAVAPLSLSIPDRNPITRSRVEAAKIMKALFKNAPLKIFLGANACLYTCFGVINSVAIFLVDIGLGLPNSFFSLFLIQYTTAVIAAPLLVRFAGKVGKHIVLNAMLCLLVVTSVIGFVLPMGSYASAVVWICLMGVICSGMYIFPPSILADIIDYDTVKSGEERAGIYMAALNLVFKLGLALGVGIAYGFLGIAGFDASAPSHTADDVLVIRMAFFGISPVLLIPAIYLLCKFPITKKVQQELRRKISAQLDSSKVCSKNSATVEVSTASVAAILPGNS